MLISAMLVSFFLLAHEAAHILAVKTFGGQVKKVGISLGLTANVRGLENMKGWQKIVVYMAGPAVNVLFAIGALAAARFYFNTLLLLVTVYNLTLCFFNLLPAFPLDGGRITQIFLSRRMGILKANRIILKSGMFIGAVLMFLGVVQVILYPWNITLFCAGLYIRKKNKQLPPYLYWEYLKTLEIDSKNGL